MTSTNLATKKPLSLPRYIASRFALLAAMVFVLLAGMTFTFSPGGAVSVSNKPTFLHGDVLIINKLAYGFSDTSCPAMFGIKLSDYCGALYNGNDRIFGSDPERGDIIIFADRTSGMEFQKRVIGLPGETITLKDGQVFIDGEAVQTEAIDTHIEPIVMPADPYAMLRCTSMEGASCMKDQFRETLPNGKSYRVLSAANEPTDNAGPFEVPEGHFFVLGDNRDNSLDSRAAHTTGEVGYVARGDIVGKVSLILGSIDPRESLRAGWRPERFMTKPD